MVLVLIHVPASNARALPFTGTRALEKMHGYFQDINGTFHAGGPGVFIPQDLSGEVPNAPEFSFLADYRCNKANSRPDSLALFCAGSCIRKGKSHVIPFNHMTCILP